MTNSYKRVPVTPLNKPKFSRLAPFIPKCPSSNFPQWAIKSTSQETLNNPMFISEISGENIDSQAIAVNTTGRYYYYYMFILKHSNCTI
jgi:hypothetical protein